MVSENETVAQLSEYLAVACGYNHMEAKTIGWAAELHDVGKSLLPQSLLQKPGKLLPNEFEEIKLHTTYGERILTTISGEKGRIAREIALLHHEWYNGNGYWGYKASYLPRYIGVVSLCDVFVALANKRAYKDKWPYDEIVDYIHAHAGTKFCPRLVDTFLTIVGEATDKG